MSNPMYSPNDDQQDEVLDWQEVPVLDDEKTNLLKENMKLTQQLASLTGNPHVIKVLQATQQGRDITVIPVDDLVKLQQPEKKPEPVDFSNFSPEDTIKYTQNLLSSEFKNTLQETLGEVVTPLKQEINTLKDQLKISQENQVNETIKDAITKNPDMKNYLVEMRDLTLKHPTITDLNQLYLLAKSMKGELPPNVKSGDRPSTPPARKKVVRDLHEEDNVQKQTLTQKLNSLLRDHDTIKNISKFV